MTFCRKHRRHTKVVDDLQSNYVVEEVGPARPPTKQIMNQDQDPQAGPQGRKPLLLVNSIVLPSTRMIHTQDLLSSIRFSTFCLLWWCLVVWEIGENDRSWLQLSCFKILKRNSSVF
jgi:hypothetical protein